MFPLQMITENVKNIGWHHER